MKKRTPKPVRAWAGYCEGKIHVDDVWDYYARVFKTKASAAARYEDHREVFVVDAATYRALVRAAKAKMRLRRELCPNCARTARTAKKRGKR